MTVLTCPCCGSHVERDAPLVDLNENTIAWQGRVRLSPRRIEICEALASSFDRHVPTNEIVRRVYGGKEPSAPEAVIYSEIHRMRPALRSIGLSVAGERGGVRVRGIRMFACARTGSAA